MAPVPAAVLPVVRVQAAAVPMRAVVAAARTQAVAAVPMRIAAVAAHTQAVAAARRALAAPIAAVVHTPAESATVPEQVVTLLRIVLLPASPAQELPAVQS